MKDTELKSQRDRDLFLCYQKALRENDFRDQWEAIEYVRKQPAPKFYISSKVCSLLLGKLFAGKPIGRMHPLAYKRLKRLAEMYQDVASGVIGKRGYSRERICESLVEMPAPEFYLSHNYAVRIIAKEMHKHNEKLLKRRAV